MGAPWKTPPLNAALTYAPNILSRLKLSLSIFIFSNTLPVTLMLTSLCGLSGLCLQAAYYNDWGCARPGLCCSLSVRTLRSEVPDEAGSTEAVSSPTPATASTSYSLHRSRSSHSHDAVATPPVLSLVLCSCVCLSSAISLPRSPYHRASRPARASTSLAPAPLLSLSATLARSTSPREALISLTGLPSFSSASSVLAWCVLLLLSLP